MLVLGTQLGTLWAADYYVPEDGVANATDALNTALATGKNVALSPGVTYLIDKPLVMQAGQTIYGNNATLKRVNQVSTTTTTTITSGVTTTITVASATGFRVGQYITIENGGSYDTGGGVGGRLISAISGNQITVAVAFGINVSGTTNVYLTGYTLLATPADTRVYDLWINGNKANVAFRRWEVTTEILFGGDRSLFHGCRLYDVPGEGFQSDISATFVTVRDCSVTDCNGNGIHFSGDTHIVVDGSRFKNCNLDTNVGHADGCIAWSNSISHATISNCYMENGLAGIGSIDDVSNSDVTIIGNTITGCTANGIEMRCLSDPGPSNIVIVGNRIYNSVIVEITSAVSVVADFPDHIIFSGNVLKNTLFKAQKVEHLIVEGNEFEYPTDTTNKLVFLENTPHVICRGNDVHGGSVGIWCDGATSENVLIADNICKSQLDIGIKFAVASINNAMVRDNAISVTAPASAYDGIVGFGRCVIADNQINMSGGGHAGVYPQNNCIVQGNYVRHGTATFSIRCDGGTSGIIVKDNTVTTAVSDAAANTLRNNDVVS